jgi:hypothetical protein
MKKSIVDVLSVEDCGARGMEVDGYGSCESEERSGFEFNGITAVCARRVLRFEGIRGSNTAKDLSWRWFGGT